MLAASKSKLVAALDARLVADWRRAHLFWSNRIAAFWTAFSVAWLMMPALQAVIDQNVYVGLSALMSIAFVWARLTSQKGLVNG
jgi:hypothetical protein